MVIIRIYSLKTTVFKKERKKKTQQKVLIPGSFHIFLPHFVIYSVINDQYPRMT